ncbi:MAG TPA: pentapeptide repeat-containing protein [Beijerinckiaceae bacterium]|nr:pentapeptide repeat-containing protein [Beijerinckiaceae bacterium]
MLPAAHKIVGPTAMTALAPHLDHAGGWIKLFVQFCTVHDQHYAWSHTHGMEHLGLPDLECRTALNDAAMGEQLILGCIHHLMKHGGDALNIGDFVAAEEEGERLLSRFWICPPREVVDHDYGAYGAVQLVPDRRPYDADGNLMDAVSQLTSIIAAKNRARDLDLHDAQLAGIELSHLEADRLDLRHADLAGARLCGAGLRDCRLDEATLEGCDCSGATVRQCVLDGVHGSGLRFDGARLEDSSARGADLARASILDARLTETSFARAVLREAVFDEATGDGVEFRGADLSRASLRGVQLDEADFRGADLTDADLSGGRFRGADFRGAILDGTRFDGADCEGAGFDNGEGPQADQHVCDPEEAAASQDATAEAVLHEGWAALHGVLAAFGAQNADVLDQLQRAATAIDASPDEPPEDWKPWLEPLMKMANGEQPLDLQRILAALSSLAQAGRSREDGADPP